jgi:hypothetical protein
MQDQSLSNVHTTKALYVMHKSASPALGIVANLGTSPSITTTPIVDAMIYNNEEERRTLRPCLDTRQPHAGARRDPTMHNHPVGPQG